MRIVHLTPHLPPDQAANAILPSQLGVWSAARGHSVAYVAYPPAQGGAPEAPDAGPVTWVPRRARGGLLRHLKIDALWLSRQYADVLDQVADQANLLHLHSNGLLIESGATWARQHHVPYVLTLYGTEIWHYQRRRIFDFFTRAYFGAAAVTFYSQGLLDHARMLGLERPDLSVVYPAVPEHFRPIDETERSALRARLGLKEPHVIVNVKRLHELAGQSYLLDAFADIRRTRADVRLVICGTGPRREALDAQARQLQIADAVTFTGLIPNEQVGRYVAAASVFALPSLLEALPTVAVEALAAGTPVVSADHPGGVELNQVFGQDVHVVPMRNRAALAAALRSAIERPRRTQAATADTLTRLFRPAAIDLQYQAVYDRILERR
jgi:glycosyltransferase involved in cell wall biosynthesis